MASKYCVRLLPVISRHISRNKFCLLQRETPKIWALSSYDFVKTSRHYTTDVAKVKEPAQQSKNTRQTVYNGILSKQIKVVKIFSLSTSLLGILVQPLIYNELSNSKSMPFIIGACTFIGFFTFVTPMLLHFITKKYVTHLDFKPDTQTYVASTLNFFCRTKEIEFKIEDVKVPTLPGMFTTFEVNGIALFLDPRLFEDPSHYAKIMGYDKPIDFKLYETSEEKKS